MLAVLRLGQSKSTATLSSAREEAKEPSVVSHWRREDRYMQWGDVCEEGAEPGSLVCSHKSTPHPVAFELKWQNSVIFYSMQD